MELQEKKYRVDKLTDIQKKLDKVGATKGNEIVTTHYYGEHEGNDVEKLVEYTDRTEIHVLEESSGRFTLTENIPMKNKEEGFTWLKERGYTTLSIVKMAYTEYVYKNGTVGLYVIDDFLYSVILYFPEGVHDEIEKEFGLEHTEVVTLPYNKYLAQLGRLRSMKLS